MTDLGAEPVASSGAAARVLSYLEEATWVLGAFEHLVRSGALSRVAPELEPELEPELAPEAEPVSD